MAGGSNMTGTEVLIGMDIISLGDFAVTNLNNKTWFTFRMPSVARLDFVKEIRKESSKKQKDTLKVKAKRKLEKRNKRTGRRKK